MQIASIIIISIVAAILYGVIHDQITARICIEYFTVGHPRLIDSNSPTILGLFWGVVATWWAGLAVGIGLAAAARIGTRPKLTSSQIIRPIITLLGWMFVVAIIAGIVGYTTSSAGIFSLAPRLATRIPEDRHIAFLTAGWAHSGSYLAGFVGGIVLCVVTWRRRRRIQKEGEQVGAGDAEEAV